MKPYYPLLKQGLRLLSPGGRFGKLQILLYHRVLAERDPLRPWEITKTEFDEQMQLLSQMYTVLSLTDALDKLFKGELPAQAVCITFDDGYADNLQVGLPILLKYNLPATFFIATGFLNGRNMWNDNIIESIRLCDNDIWDLKAFGLGKYSLETKLRKKQTTQQLLTEVKHMPPEKRNEVVQWCVEQAQSSIEPLMLTAKGVKSLADSGMEIGAHTVNHPILAKLNKTDSEFEIKQSQKDLQQILNQPIRMFAYPNGFPGRDYALEHCQIVKEAGFDYAFSTWWGAADKTMNPFELPRFTPWDRDPLKFMLRMAQYRHNTKGQPVQEV